jgi:hypothetical protein
MTFGELTLYTLHFYWFIQNDSQKWKIQGHFQLERRYKGESATENALRRSESDIHVRLICLTRQLYANFCLIYVIYKFNIYVIVRILS